ncbi:hypothetical protein V8D89_012566 [Ganoderma adspersum]
MPPSQLNVDVLQSSAILFKLPTFQTSSPWPSPPPLDASIRKFHSFLFADAPARAPHVRALDINVMWPFPHETEDHSGNVSLLDILASCSRLHHISVVLEQALGRFSLSIVHAIAAQKTHYSLNVVAPVKTVDIITGYWYPLALEQFLPRVALTLEERDVYRFMVHQDYIQSSGGILTEPVFTMTQYPAVRSLTTPGFMGKPLLDHLYYLFPTLDILHLGKLHDSVREDAYAQVRAENQRAQERSCVWKKLDRIICDSRMLYVLSLRCPIRHVKLDYCKMNEQRYTADALRENPVPHLKVTLGYGRTMVDELFAPELALKLTHLTLCMSYYNHINIHSGPEGSAIPRLRWGDVLDKMVSTLKPLHRLTHLRIVIHAAVFVYKDAVSPFAPPEEHALTFDEEGMLVALHDEVAETIIRQEDLVLSELDEDESPHKADTARELEVSPTLQPYK